MSTVGVGVDVVDVERFSSAIDRRPALLERLFTEQERSDAHGQAARFAARFAAKEAVLKTLGVGIGAAPWRSIEIRRDASGAPSVQLHGVAAEIAQLRGVGTLHVSMTHTKMTAAAFVVASTEGELANAR